MKITLVNPLIRRMLISIRHLFLFVNLPRYDGLPVKREDGCEIVNRYLVSPPYYLIQIASVLRE